MKPVQSLALVLSGFMLAYATTFVSPAYSKDEKVFDRKKMEKRIEVRVGGNSIVIGEDIDDWSNASLRRRIQNLEYAVKALYWKLDLLEEGYGYPVPPVNTGSVNCTLELSFNTYSALGASEAEARHKVMEQCTAKESFASNCKADKMKCVK